MVSIKDKLLRRIKGHGTGWAFSCSDFSDLATPASIRWNLLKLKEGKEIRQILRGVYDFPPYSELLQEQLPPDVDNVARAIARKNVWNIQVSGNAALYFLGLSTQVPGRFVYYSDGPTKTYTFDTACLEFKHISKKESVFHLRKSELIAQAIRAIGKDGMTDFAEKTIASHVSDEAEWQRILKDLRPAAEWVINIVQKIHDLHE